MAFAIIVGRPRHAEGAKPIAPASWQHLEGSDWHVEVTMDWARPLPGGHSFLGFF